MSNSSIDLSIFGKISSIITALGIIILFSGIIMGINANNNVVLIGMIFLGFGVVGLGIDGVIIFIKMKRK